MTAEATARFLIEIVALTYLTGAVVIAIFAAVTTLVEVAVTEVFLIAIFVVVTPAVGIAATNVNRLAEFSVWGAGFRRKNADVMKSRQRNRFRFHRTACYSNVNRFRLSRGAFHGCRVR